MPSMVRRIAESSSNGLRATVDGSLSLLRRTFWPVSSATNKRVNIARTRSLYRNDDETTLRAAGMVRRIINSTPEFMGLPSSSTGDEVTDEFLNDCIHLYWADKLVEMIRDTVRDSKTVVRIRQADMKLNKLVSENEARACYLEIVPPEDVEIFYSTQDATVIDRAIITHTIEEIVEEGDMRQGKLRTRQHVIIEQITADEYTYWDQTLGEDRPDLNQANSWGFVPLMEVFNEFDAYLGAGQSDIESSFVFIEAFHDVMTQTLLAHKHHSIPKAKFNVQDVQSFLMNNFPESFQQDENGLPMANTFNGSVSWQGTEILFFDVEEDGGFLEAKSVLGDSITLLEFLLDCIAMASETPKYVLMHDVGAVDHSESLTFVKKIERKRVNFTFYFQRLCKMVLAINKFEPVTVKFAWPEIDPDSLVIKAQTLQQVSMSLELASERQLISDNTAREYLRKFIPNMKPAAQEAADAKNNITLAAPPNSPSGRTVTGSGNVGGGAGE